MIMTDTEFAAWLRSMRHADTHEDCVKIEERIEKVEHDHDVERGPWVPYSEIVHHTYQESRH